MNRTGRAFLAGVLLVAVSTAAFAQGYPVPAKTQETPVSCGSCAGGPLKTVGYKAPIATFTGRFLDSNLTTEWFQPFRTARANYVQVMPNLNRIYLRYGDGSVASYALDTFFTRLEAGEQLVFPVRPVPANRVPTPEVFLNWDTYFNPELSNWKLVQADGAVRMPSFDVDDQGYVYIASTIYGWGIVKDALASNGAQMKSVIQKFPAAGTDPAPNKVAALKSGNKYYAYLDSSAAPLWDVTDRSNPVQVHYPVPSIPNKFARNASGDHFTMINSSRSMVIYDVATFVTGAAPQYTSPNAGYTFVASDGTNFYGLRPVSAGQVMIDVISQSGAGYVLQGSYQVPTVSAPGGFRAGDGYLVITGIDATAWDLRVYKLNSSLVPTAVPLDASPADPTHPSYFRNYYSAPPISYSKPGYINIVDGLVYKAPSTGKNYLVFCGRGIGDVYELQAGDAITVTGPTVAGTTNPNAPSAPAGTVVYGDPVQFVGKSASASVSSVTWNFGNPEGGSANTAQLTSPNQATIPYQYSNLSKTTLTQRNVVAMSAGDSNVNGKVTVTMQAPVARFGISGQLPKYLFAAPNASSPAPIVLGDTFVDASDGTIDSHYTSWALDGTTTKSTPNTPFGVGQCGGHSLAFQTFYGPYSGAGSTLTTTHPANSVVTPVDYIVGLNPANPNDSTFNYSVLPFVAAMTYQSSTDGSSIVFTDATRITNDAAVRAMMTTGLTYKWELVVNGVASSLAPVGTASTYTLLKSALNGLTNAQVRLTRTSPPLSGTSCAGYETSVALSAPLNKPAFTVAQSGNCTTAPCTFTITPAAGTDPVGENWKYQWVINGNATLDSTAVTAPSTTSNTFSPTFLKTGSYAITVNVTNGVGTTNAAAATITITVSPCAKLGGDSYQAVYSGQASGCSSAPGSKGCNSGETVFFTAQVNMYSKTPYNPACSQTTYKWTFPDGSTQTVVDPTATVQQAVSNSGTVTLTVSNGNGDSASYTVALTVGGGVVNPPPTTNPCAGMTAANVFASVTGPSCLYGPPCSMNDTLTFQVQTYGYSASCLSGATTWSFGDGQSGTGVTTSHKYAAANVYNGTVTVRNSANETVTRPFQVTTTAGGGTPACGTMTNQTVFVNFTGNTCSGGTCQNGDTITFSVQGYGGFDLACANPQYDWDFGDGSAHASSAQAPHAYSTPGQHSGSVKLTTAAQTFTRTFVVTTTGSGGSGGCAPVTPNLTLSITYANASGTCGPFGQCNPGEALNFDVMTYGSYDIGCATHTYDWDFGDNSQHATTKKAVHQYAAGGTYHAKCIVNNGTSYTLTQDVIIGGNPVGGQVQPVIAVDAWAGVDNGYIFHAVFDHPEFVKSWIWNFGDGTTKTVKGDSASNPTPVKYAYSDNKKYTVTLTTYASTDATGSPNGTDNAPNEPSSPPKRRSVRH